MSRARKHVLQEALAGEIEPPGPDQYIVRALGARGGNLIEVRLRESASAAAAAAAAAAFLCRDPLLLLLTHPSFAPAALSSKMNKQVERPDKSTCMVLLPAKFHKKMWIKRGGFLIVRAPPEAAASGARLAGEVERVLYEQEVSGLKGMAGVWPKEFEEEGEGEEGGRVNGRAGGAGATTAGGGAGGGGAGQGGSGGGGAGPSGGKKTSGGDAGAADSDSDDSGLPPLEENPNRRRQTYATSSSESDSEEEEEEEGDEEEDEK